MKTRLLVYIALSCLVFGAFSTNPVETKPVHVSEMVIGNPNTMVKDRHPLWRNFENHSMERPFMHGVVGPQWTPIYAEKEKYKHIASPMPRSESPVTRITAEEFPEITYSPSSFDLPLRKDVVQIDIPRSTVRTTEEHLDPRFPLKRPVSTVSGTLFHGTYSSDPLVTHGIPSFLEKTQSENPKNDGLVTARGAENKVTRMIDRVTYNPAGTNYMVLKAAVTNKREVPDIKLNRRNKRLKRRLWELKHTPAGARTMHTYSVLS